MNQMIRYPDGTMTVYKTSAMGPTVLSLWEEMMKMKEPCVDECFGCNRQRVGPAPGPAVCVSYAYPSAQWKHGRKCPLATNLQKQEKKEGFVDPMKRSKKAMKVKK